MHEVPGEHDARPGSRSERLVERQTTTSTQRSTHAFSAVRLHLMIGHGTRDCGLIGVVGHD